MLNDLHTAFAFLTILPVGMAENSQPGRSFAYFPLVGLVIGGILSATALLVDSRTTPEIQAFAVLLLWVTLTGGLHLDGFADCCDGLLATTNPARRLEIMKDPHTGSWALIGVVVLLLGKWAALQGLAPVVLIIPPVLGRWGMVLAAWFFPYARSTGVGAYFRTGLGRSQVMAASVMTCLLIVALTVMTRPALIFLIALPPLVIYGMGRWAAGRLGGGLTGDVYGALCEVTELVTMLVLEVWARN
jgi:adenosylcobinamide-GDP ribazoletransferase